VHLQLHLRNNPTRCTIFSYYYFTTPLHVSGPFVAHHQEAECIMWRLSASLPTVAIEVQWNLGSRTLLFTNNSVHERSCSRTIRFTNNFPSKNGLGLRTRKLATAASSLYRRGSVSCWLSNLVSVYEHFGSRTASRNGLSSWTEVPL
jgi:hypothetical protein